MTLSFKLYFLGSKVVPVYQRNALLVTLRFSYLLFKQNRR